MKQAAVGGLLGHLIGTMGGVQRKWSRRYPSIWVLDLTAGPGIYEDGMLGSPLLMARHVQIAIGAGIPITFSCCERNARTLAKLQETFGTSCPDVPVRFYRDQVKLLGEVPPDALILAYLDPNRWNELLVDRLREMGGTFRSMDVLFTRECGASLRMQGARHTRHMATIEDYITAMGKKKTYIARYAVRQNWALVFGSNWEERPARMLRWRGGQLHEVQSQQGQALIRHFLLGGKREGGAVCSQLALPGWPLAS
jgi:hypothetical protein